MVVIVFPFPGRRKGKITAPKRLEGCPVNSDTYKTIYTPKLSVFQGKLLVVKSAFKDILVVFLKLLIR